MQQEKITFRAFRPLGFKKLSLLGFKKLKNNKAQGLDGIPAEMLKNTDENITVKELREECTVVFRKENIPEDWKISGLIMRIPKQGNLAARSNLYCRLSASF